MTGAGRRSAAGWLTAAGALACAWASAGCQGNPPPTPTPIGAPGTFDLVNEAVIASGCAFASCHAGAQPAARLDLSGPAACAALRDGTSCVVKGRQMVVPGNGADSFLMQKLIGDDLPAPDGDCAATDLRMPYGGVALPADKLEVVQSWIEHGAECPGTMGGGAGGQGGDGAGEGTGGAGGDDGGGGEVFPIALTVDAPTLLVGQGSSFHVRLSGVAPVGGLTVQLVADDRDVVALPSFLLVPAGAVEATGPLVAKRPSVPIVIRARAAAMEVITTVQVTGLRLTEIWTHGAAGGVDRLQWVKIRNDGVSPVDLAGYAVAAGRARWSETVLRLSGMVAPGGCALIGGPDSTAENGGPHFTTAVDFTPDLPVGLAPGAGNAGFGLFVVGGAAQDGGLIGAPLDAVGIGAGTSSATLTGGDGSPLIVASPEAGAGQSVARVGGAWRAQAPDVTGCPP